MFFLLTHSSECLKSNLDLFSSLSIQTSSQWIYCKPIISLADDASIDSYPVTGENYLDLMHTMLSLRIRIETPFHTRSRVNYSRQRGQSRLCKSFTTFHVQSNRRIFQSKVRVASKQRLRISSIYRGIIIKLRFTRKNFSSDLLLVGHGYPRFHGRKMSDSKTPNQAFVRRARYIREECALGRVRAKFHRASLLRCFQSG